MAKKKTQPNTPKKLQPSTTVMFLDFRNKKLIGQTILNFKGEVISKWGKNRSITASKRPTRGPDDEPA